MYSPKIQPDLIPKLYRKAKARGMAMTHLVNEIISGYLKNEPEPSDEAVTKLDFYSTIADNPGTIKAESA